MPKYRKKPIVIEAIQFDASDATTHDNVCFGWPKADGDTTPHELDGKHWVSTLEGPLHVSEGDYIITGIKGEHYPCKPDIFEASYDAVAD